MIYNGYNTYDSDLGQQDRTPDGQRWPAGKSTHDLGMVFT